MKPIEPGCLVIIRRQPYFGVQATVIESADYPRHTMPNGVEAYTAGPGRWVIETSAPVGVMVSSGAYIETTMVTCHERYLLRIDGHEPEAVDATTDEEITARQTANC